MSPACWADTGRWTGCPPCDRCPGNTQYKNVNIWMTPRQNCIIHYTTCLLFIVLEVNVKVIKNCSLNHLIYLNRSFSIDRNNENSSGFTVFNRTRPFHLKNSFRKKSQSDLLVTIWVAVSTCDLRVYLNRTYPIVWPPW